jgi:hypothetical protein
LIQSKNNNSTSGDALVNTQLLTDDLGMTKKIGGNPYVESITYYTFPTRNSTPVFIILKKEVSEQKIDILFEDKEISFDKNGKELTVMANKNGVYTMTINDITTLLIVNTINEYAPEVTGVQHYENYLQLNINDELSQINYEKSYVLSENKKYQITTNNQVKGSFNGKVVIYIFNDLDQYIYYEINVK